MDVVQTCTETCQPPQTVTALLKAVRTGEPGAFDRLMTLVYEELRRMAHHKLRYERADHTLKTTDLVHEAYLRLAHQQWAQVHDAPHFFAIAAQAMRRILVSHARKRQAVKRGGQVCRVSLHDALDESAAIFAPEQAEDLLALDAALTKLERFNERGCRVVEYRFFGGMTHEEIAEVMGLSIITVRRAWTYARVWLRKEMCI